MIMQILCAWVALSFPVGLIVGAAIPQDVDSLPRQYGEGEWVRGEDFNHNEGVY